MCLQIKTKQYYTIPLSFLIYGITYFTSKQLFVTDTAKHAIRATSFVKLAMRFSLDAFQPAMSYASLNDIEREK